MDDVFDIDELVAAETDWLTLSNQERVAWQLSMLTGIDDSQGYSPRSRRDRCQQAAAFGSSDTRTND